MQIAVVGGGFAGLALCWHLLQSGHQVTLFEKKAIGAGASGIAAGLLHPYPGEQGRRSKYALEGLNATKQLLEAAAKSLNQSVADYSGIVRLVKTQEEHLRFLDHAKRYGDVEHVQEERFVITSGITVFTTLYLQGLHKACVALGAQTRFEKIGSLNAMKEYDRAFIAAGAGIMAFQECAHLKTKYIKGQVLTCKRNSHTPAQSHVAKGYVACGESPDYFYLGSTYERQWDSEEPNLTVAQEQLLPKAKSLLSETPTILECRAALRVMHVGDYMPLAQQVTERTWVLGALGSRGLLYHAYLAQQLVSKIGDV